MSLIAIDVAGVLGRYRQACGSGATKRGVPAVVSFFKARNKTVIGIMPEALEKAMPKFVRFLFEKVVTYVDDCTSTLATFAVDHLCAVVTNAHLVQHPLFQALDELQIRFTFSAQGEFCPGLNSQCKNPYHFSTPGTDVATHETAKGPDLNHTPKLYLIVCSYDGVEQDELGNAELGYLSLQAGNEVEVLPHTQQAGHCRNKFHNYIYGQSRTLDGKTQQGWLPTYCIDRPAQSNGQLDTATRASVPQAAAFSTTTISLEENSGVDHAIHGQRAFSNRDTHGDWQHSDEQLFRKESTRTGRALHGAVLHEADSREVRKEFHVPHLGFSDQPDGHVHELILKLTGESIRTWLAKPRRRAPAPLVDWQSHVLQSPDREVAPWYVQTLHLSASEQKLQDLEHGVIKIEICQPEGPPLRLRFLRQQGRHVGNGPRLQATQRYSQYADSQTGQSRFSRSVSDFRNCDAWSSISSSTATLLC